MIGGRGKDDPKDYQEALKWWRMAADQGFVPAQASLGLMYYDGQGVPKDYVLAYMWINLAPSNSTVSRFIWGSSTSTSPQLCLYQILSRLLNAFR